MQLRHVAYAFHIRENHDFPAKILSSLMGFIQLHYGRVFGLRVMRYALRVRRDPRCVSPSPLLEVESAKHWGTSMRCLEIGMTWIGFYRVGIALTTPREASTSIA